MIETKAVIDILARETSLDPATLTTETVIRDLAVDSLGMMNVMFGLEEMTGIELQVEEMNDVVTIGDLVRLIETKEAMSGRQT
jgi:acyl carrier protein